jgi:predicted HTH transcriptional regulator
LKKLVPTEEDYHDHPRESHTLDRKSLRLVTGPTANFADLAYACVCFANAAGGTLFIGIEGRRRRAAHRPARRTHAA